VTLRALRRSKNTTHEAPAASVWQEDANSGRLVRDIGPIELVERANVEVFEMGNAQDLTLARFCGMSGFVSVVAKESLRRPCAINLGSARSARPAGGGLGAAEAGMDPCA
jgi:hypothetical protein